MLPARVLVGHGGMPTLHDVAGLVSTGLIAPATIDRITAVERRYAVAITPAMQALIQHPDDPIGRQFVPRPRRTYHRAA